MMCPWVVFTLVIGKIFFAGVPFYIIDILCFPKNISFPLIEIVVV